MNFDPSVTGGAAGALIAAVLYGINWLRQNRIADAKAEAQIAVAHGDAAKHEGQAAEIERLSKTVSELSQTQSEQAKRISHLEARFIGVEAHFQSLALCDPCREKNASIIARLIEALKL